MPSWTAIEATKHYTHISSNAARRAIEMLDQKEPYFVDVFVDKSKTGESDDSKLFDRPETWVTVRTGHMGYTFPLF